MLDVGFGKKEESEARTSAAIAMVETNKANLQHCHPLPKISENIKLSYIWNLTIDNQLAKPSWMITAFCPQKSSW